MSKIRSRKVSKKSKKNKRRIIKNLKGSGKGNKNNKNNNNPKKIPENLLNNSESIKRFKIEQKILADNGYEVIINQINEMEIIVNNKDDYTFKIVIENIYPFKSPIINGINFSKNSIDFIDLNLTSNCPISEEDDKLIFYKKDTKIIDLLNILINKKNILIYCHPKSANTHFLKNHLIIPALIGEDINNDVEKEKALNKGKLIYDKANKITLDITNYESLNVFSNYGPTILADGFSDDFIDKNQIYDYVFLPDCSGDWWFFQINKKYDKFINLILKLTKLLKIDGKLIMSKFVNEKYYNQVFQDFQLKHSDNFQIKKFTIDNIKFLMITKKTLI